LANKNKFSFDVPIPIIVLAFFINPVIGGILVVLRSISSSLKSSEKNEEKSGNNPYYHTSMNSQEHKAPAKKKSAGKKKSSPAYGLMILGCIASLVLSFISAISLDLFHLQFPSILGAFLVGVLPFIVAAGGLLLGSKAVKERDVRYARIRTLIGNKQSLNLTKIAAASNESLKRVRKDVQRMIDKGEFGETAYIDLGTNNFMRTPDATPDEPEQFDYRKVYGNVFTKDKTVDDEKPAEEKKTGSETEDNFAAIIREIRRLNDEIKDEEVSDRIYKIEGHTKNIFDYVTDHLEAMPQIRTFMNYYLPTTLKLLESYSRIERVGVAGENMKKSKENIEKTLDMLAVGFEGQVDQLFKNESIDISSDIAVLEAMMQKDGIGGKSNYDIAAMMNGYTDEISDDISSGAAAAKKE